MGLFIPARTRHSVATCRHSIGKPRRGALYRRASSRKAARILGTVRGSSMPPCSVYSPSNTA